MKTKKEAQELISELGLALPIDEKSLQQDFTELFDDESWESGDGAITEEMLRALKLTDVTHDERWFSELFEGDGHRLGAYKDDNQNYYILWYNESEKEYILSFEGDESDILQHCSKG